MDKDIIIKIIIHTLILPHIILPAILSYHVFVHFKME